MNLKGNRKLYALVIVSLGVVLPLGLMGRMDGTDCAAVLTVGLGLFHWANSKEHQK